MDACTFDNTSIVYLYKTGDTQDQSNENSLPINDALLQLLSITNKIVNIDIADGYEELDQYIINSPSNERVVISNNFVSSILKDIVLHLKDVCEDDKIFIINSSSTLADEVLAQNYILRLYPPDNINTSVIYSQFLNGQKKSDNNLIVIDDSEWSQKLAKAIESLSPEKNFTIKELNDNTPIPPGTLNVIMLTIPGPGQSLFDIFADRKDDIVGMLLGDSYGGFVPTSQEQLTQLQKWNSLVIIPAQSGPSQITIEDMARILGYVPNIPVTLMSVNLSVSAYIRNSVCPQRDFNNLYLIGGMRLNRNLDDDTYIFVGMKFEMVGMYATGVGPVEITIPER